MNKRILGIVVLLALAIALVWTLKARTPATELAEPAHLESPAKPVDPAPLTASDAVQPARESVEPHAAVESSAPGSVPAEGAPALIKVLVLNKATHAPMAGIEVTSSYDDRSVSHAVEEGPLARQAVRETPHRPGGPRRNRAPAELRVTRIRLRQAAECRIGLRQDPASEGR